MTSWTETVGPYRADATPSRMRVLATDGMSWRVYEAAYSSTDRRTGISLIFDAELVIRRVRNFPANWYELSDEDLYALSLGP